MRSGGLRVLVPFTIVVALGYASFVGTGMQALGSLPRYLSEEYFNPGLVRSIVAAPAAPLLAMAAWVAWVAWRRPSASLVDRVVPTIGGFVVLSPNVFPWYALWLVPFLAVAPSVWWIAFTGTVALAYAFFLYQPWAIPMWARLLEIAPIIVGASWWLGTTLRHGSATGNSQPRDTRAAPGGTIAETPGDASQAGR